MKHYRDHNAIFCHFNKDWEENDMADTTKVKKAGAETRVEQVVKDTAEAAGIGAVLSFVWTHFIEPHVIGVGAELKERVKREYSINRGHVSTSILMMPPAKRTILLARLQKAIDKGTNTHFMSMLSKFVPDEKTTFTTIFTRLASMKEPEFDEILSANSDRVADWLHLIRMEGRQMLRKDFGFVADAAKAVQGHLGAAAQSADESAGQLAPRINAFAQSLRDRRLGATATRSTTNPTAAHHTEGRQKGDWQW